MYAYHRKVYIANKPDLFNIRNLDQGCIPMIHKMHQNGIAIDIERLDSITCDLMKLEDEYKREILEYVPKENLAQFTAALSNDEDGALRETGKGLVVDEFAQDLDFNINSGDQLAELLFTHLKIGAAPGQKLKKTKGGERLATDKKQLEILNKGTHAHPVLDKILKYREAFKLRTTYTEKLPKIARFDPKTGTLRIYTTFTVTRTSTGRLASKSPNLMNIPFKTEIGRKIRAAFIPSPGKYLVGADFSQIELRILAHCSQDKYMLDIYQNNGDIHVATAMRAFGKTLEEVSSEEGKMLYRLPCKRVNFGIAYGLAAPGLQQQLAMEGLNWTVEQCETFIDYWFEIYPGVKDLLDIYYYRARRYNLVWDIFGRIRLVPEWRSQHSWIRNAGLRQAGNMPIQGGAQGFTKLAMGYLEEENESLRECGYSVEPLLQIHDEILQEVDMEIADDVLKLMERRMSNLIELRVPVLADGKVMKERWKKAG